MRHLSQPERTAGHAADVDPEHAQQFAEEALQAVVGAEILTAREASR